MSQFLIGIGSGLEIADLEPFIQQPQSPEGVHNAQRDLSASGLVFDSGLHIPLLWTMIPNVTVLGAILAQMGLDDEDTLRQAVTIYAPTRRRNWHLYDGFAIMPRVLTFSYFPTNLRVVVNRLNLLE